MSLNESQYNNTPKSSRVFISYSHDSSKHKECVLKLSNLLRSEGIDCNIDQYETSPSEGWLLWMVNQIEEADFVLVVCTENYETRFKGKEEAGRGLGAKWEGAIITQELYYSEVNNKCIPIVFSPEDSKYIPSILKNTTYYTLNKEEINDENYDKLYARLTDQILVAKPDLGKLRQLASKTLSSSVSSQNKGMDLVGDSQKSMIGKLRKITAGDQNSEIPKTFISPSTHMQFVLIPPGEFMMGSDEFSLGRPVHKVTIKDFFYMGKYPVTQKHWETVMGSNPSKVKGNSLPVESVSWNDVQEFIKRLNDKESTNKYRLPSEAEWEYTCRADTQTKYCFGDDKSKLGDYAWYARNSGRIIHTVGQKKQNFWGLYDMHGNVNEWVQDGFHSNYVDAPTDGSAWEGEDSSLHIRRGGSFNSGDFSCQSADYDSAPSDYSSPTIGFRLLREL